MELFSHAKEIRKSVETITERVDELSLSAETHFQTLLSESEITAARMERLVQKMAGKPPVFLQVISY